MPEKPQSTPKDPSDSVTPTVHGLTEKQVEQLFGEQGEFSSLNEAWKVLWQKAQFAAQWLSSYWTADTPEQVVAAFQREETRVAEFHAELQATEPETYKELMAWNEKTIAEQAQDENIVHDRHPLAGYVMSATSIDHSDQDYQLAQDTYKAVCETARLSVADASEDDKAMVEYAIAVLEAYGDANWSSNNREGSLSRVEFPKTTRRYMGHVAFFPSEDRIF